MCCLQPKLANKYTGVRVQYMPISIEANNLEVSKSKFKNNYT